MASFKIFSLVLLGVALVLSTPLDNGKRLIKTSEEDPGRWLTEDEIFSLIAEGKHFIDITYVDALPAEKIRVAKNQIPGDLRHETVVRPLFANISVPRMTEFVTRFTNDFHNRFYNSANGVNSSAWLLTQIQDSISGYAGASVEYFEHANFLQNSIIARIEGRDANAKSEIVVLGAHQDSLNLAGSSLRAPGADDNASGSVTLLETLRILAENNFAFNKTVEFHWYAAEESGLLGSRDIARSYKNLDVDVIAMINYDVVGYHVDGQENSDKVSIITDYVDNALTRFLRQIVDGYLNYGQYDRPCGYACSDHAAWTENGYPAARPTQGIRNPGMHLDTDTMDHDFSFEQIGEFVKISLGFAIEIAEPASP